MSTRKSKTLRALCAAGPVLLGLSSVSAEPVFPGAVGFGTENAPSRGHTVVRVSSLLGDSSANTLRAAVSPAVCPGTPIVVVFDVSGIIHLTSHIKVKCSNTVIAGQTAPAPGIMIEGADLVVTASNVLIQHIHSRVGKEHPSSPAINNRSGITVDGGNVLPISNVVVDHVSIAWGSDQNFSTWANDAGNSVQNVTLSNSLLAEALRYTCPFGTPPGHPDFPYCHWDLVYRPPSDPNPNPNPDPDGHSTGPLIGRNTSNVSMIRNISAFNRWRNPMARESTNLQVVNNFIYWGRNDERSRMVADVGSDTSTSTLRGNVYISEPGSSSTSAEFPIRATARFMANTVNMFVADNRVHHPAWQWKPATGGSPWSIVKKDGQGTFTELPAEPQLFIDRNVPLLSPDRVEMVLTANAGARPAFRDQVDQLVLDDIASRVANRGFGTDGGYVSDPGESSGYPNWPADVRPAPGIAIPAAGNSDSASDNYTNLEEWLHTLAYQLEGDQRIARFDTFEDTDSTPNGWYADNSPGGWSVMADGATRVLDQSVTTAAADIFLNKTYFYDQVVQAKVKVGAVDGADRFARVYARYRDPNNSYYVALRSNGAVQIKKLIGGTSSVLATATLPWALNAWYSVRFSLVSGTPATAATTVLSATVKNLTTNETATLSFTDTNPLPPGFVAVGTYFASGRFDDVFVSPIGGTAVPNLMEDFEDGNDAGWTNSGGSWSVVTSGASRVQSQSNNAALLLSRSAWNTTLAGADQSVQATVKPLSFNGNSFVSVHARFVDANNNYYVTLRNTGVFELKKILAGSVVKFKEFTLPASFKLTSPHALRIDVTAGATNPVLTGYLDGNLLLTMEDDIGAPFTAAGKAAIGTFGAAAEFDNVIAMTPP